jgi:hypothetical protein
MIRFLANSKSKNKDIYKQEVILKNMRKSGNMGYLIQYSGIN